MPTAIGSTYLTLLDWAKRLDPDGSVADVVEALNQSNPILQDAAMIEGNLPTGHRSVIRTGLPTVAWRMLNYGVQPSKSTTQQVDDQCGMLDAESKVDIEWVRLNGGSGAKDRAFRGKEDDAFIESMNQTMATTLFYGDTSLYPERFLGLTPRYSLTTAANGANVVTAGGTGSDNRSIWYVTWGEQTCFMMFPKGSKAGIEVDDLGKQLVNDSASPAGQYRAYVTYYSWKLGLVLKDWRYVVRICNIDYSDLTTDASSGADLLQKCVTAFHKVFKLPKVKGKRVWYCEPAIAEYFHHQAMNKFNVNLTLDQVGGEPITRLLGAEVRSCDALATNEALVS